MNTPKIYFTAVAFPCYVQALCRRMNINIILKLLLYKHFL